MPTPAAARTRLTAGTRSWPISPPWMSVTRWGMGVPLTRLRRRSEEHTSELQSHHDLVCRLLLEKKNVLGIQSDLLGAAAMGIRNLICITGDPPKMGNYPDATAVFDVDAIGLVNIVHNLNRGLDI